MSHRHKIESREIGQVRIYMTPGERRKKTSKGIKGLLPGSPPLYMEIIKSAKEDGLMNATAHHTHYGFSGNGQVQASVTEVANPNLSLCVELIGPREELENFCRKHGDLLKDKVVVYKHMEHWDIGAYNLRIDNASPEEYIEPEE